MTIARFRGDDYPVIIAIVDKAKQPIPLTTETFILSVSNDSDPTIAPDVFTVDGTIVDAANGKVSFDITGATLAGDYHYDIQMIDTEGKKRTIKKGSYTITQDITKA